MDNDNVMQPTVEWMAKNYKKYNAELFDGKLGECKFDVRSSGIRNLGYFKFLKNNVFIDYDRRMFVQKSYLGRTYVNHDNFVELCDPIIVMNSGYSAPEEDLLNTLIHEMCHYYTFCFGRSPKQGHGPEFRRIGQIVSYKSNGRFSIQRLATADEMKRHKESEELKQKKERLEQGRLNNISAYIWETNGGRVMLCTTSSKNVFARIVNDSKYLNIRKLIVVNDVEFNKLLKANRYFANFRTIKTWDITDLLWFFGIDDIEEKYNTRTLIDNTNESVNGFSNAVTERLLRKLFWN